MPGGTILIVDDEKLINDTLKLNLELEGYRTFSAYSGSEALKLFNSQYKQIDLVLLDVMLPEITGYDLIKEFKSTDSTIPIIFLTAKSAQPDRITGLKLGADDYLAKPFDLEELLLRIQNMIRRKIGQNTASTVYWINDCNINFDTFEITDINHEKHILSKREIGLLKLLTSQPDKVISRDEIIEALWDASDNPSARTIDNYILGFRKYFEETPREPKHFHSVRGVGYKFVN